MRLISAPLSLFSAKVHIALLEKGLAFDVDTAPFSLADRYQPKHPEVLRINPKAQVPVLIHGSLELYDSTQILEYLEDVAPSPRLWPDDVAERARARRLEHWTDEVFFPDVTVRMRGSATREDRAAASAAIAGHYRTLEAALGNQEHLMGAFGFADIAAYMTQFFASFLGAPMTAETPNLMAWRERITRRPAVAAVVVPMGDYLRANGLNRPNFLPH